MKSPAAPVPAEEINRLHKEVLGQTQASQKCLHIALAAAWQAGRLLLAEQTKVRRTMGAAWGLWLEEKFSGSRRTAQNYMRLAESVKDVAEFRGLSLRQVYLRLGIATEPKSRLNSPKVQCLPPHVRLANKLLVALSNCEKTNGSTDTQRNAVRQDLRALYERLRRYFEVGAPANFTSAILSDKFHP